jgi:polyisoprenoid-binding protein YceI
MTTSATTVRYRLGPHGSRFTVQAFATGLLSFLGHSPTFAVREFTGEVGGDPQAWAGGWCVLSVRADSLELVDRVRPEDRAEIEARARREVLETERFPEIRYESTIRTAEAVADDTHRLRLQGRLSLHGVSNPLEFDAFLTTLEGWIGLAGDFTLRPSAFGIRPVTALGGAIRLEDRLKFSFALAGQEVDRQEGP